MAGAHSAKYWDLTGNNLGSDGVAALTRALFLTRADVAAVAAAAASADDARKSPSLTTSVSEADRPTGSPSARVRATHGLLCSLARVPVVVLVVWCW